MLHLLTVLLLLPQAGISDPRDERIMEFLKRNDIEAWETYLWSNPGRTVNMNDIMIVYKKQYNLDIAINFKAFPTNNRQVMLDHTVKRIIARDRLVPRGLALQLYLDNYTTDLTYTVNGGTIWIVPGAGTISDESKTSPLAQTLKSVKPKYDNGLNKEGTNRLQVPPSDLLSVLQFFAAEDKGDFRFFIRNRSLPVSFAQMRVRVPDYADMSCDAILKNVLSQVNARYIVNSGAVVIVPK